MEARDAGRQIGEALRLINFYWSMDALVKLPYILFPEYVPDSERMYNRGNVIRIDKYKYLIQNDGRIDVNNPPPTNSLCKLFRDSGRYEWVREEYVLQGFERSYDDLWYRCIVPIEDGSTPPPNNPSVWELIEK